VKLLAGYDRETAVGKRLKAAIAELKKLEVRVGFQHGDAADDNGVDIADIAMWNELGTANMPSRPFIRQTAETHESTLNKLCEIQFDSVLHGKATAKDALTKIGVATKGLMQDTIRNGEYVANAESTIKKKGSDKPLIDTGRMRQSVNYTVQKKGG
jgi:hypothetical protein